MSVSIISTRVIFWWSCFGALSPYSIGLIGSMTLQFFKFTDLPLQFIYLQPCHYNFTFVENIPLRTPSTCFIRFIGQNAPIFFLPFPLLPLSHGAGADIDSSVRPPPPPAPSQLSAPSSLLLLCLLLLLCHGSHAECLHGWMPTVVPPRTAPKHARRPTCRSRACGPAPCGCSAAVSCAASRPTRTQLRRPSPAHAA